MVDKQLVQYLMLAEAFRNCGFEGLEELLEDVASVDHGHKFEHR